MASKIRVYGEAQNRTALGIIHAYMKLNPNATISDLRKAFPEELAPDKGVPEIFVASDYVDKGEHYFTQEEELVETADGKKVAVVKLWTKPSYENLVKKAKDYDIEVAEFEQQQQVGKKGSYYLEYVNGFDPAVIEPPTAPRNTRPKFGCLAWLWAIVALIAVFLIILFLCKQCNYGNGDATDEIIVETTEVEAVTPEIVEVEGVETDAAAGTAATAAAATASTASAEVIAQLEKYQTAFDAIEYPVGEYQLKPEAKTILDNVAKLLQDNPGVKMTVNGYASREGNQEANQILSDKRASTVVNYLVSKGVAADRLKAVGLCTSNPISKELSPNRRIDFVVE